MAQPFSNPIEDIPIKTKATTKTFEQMIEEELSKEGKDRARSSPQKLESSKK